MAAEMRGAESLLPQNPHPRTMNAPTDTPPRARLANTECLAILTSSHLVAQLDDIQKRALFRAVHALARRVAYKERAARNKADKGAFFTPPEILADPPFVTPAPAPLSPDAPPMTDPSAPSPDAAETQTTNE